MKFKLESQEKIVVQGLLMMAKDAAKKDRRLRKYADRLVSKFTQNAAEINLKKTDLSVISDILHTTIEDNKKYTEENSELEDFMPKMKDEDIATCVAAKAKLDELL